MAVNYYYEVDENGKVTKKRKNEPNVSHYEVSEDGRITAVPSVTQQEMHEDVAKTSMHIAQALNSTLLGQSQMQSGSTPYAPILQQQSGKDRLKSPSERLADREKIAAMEEERKQAKNNAAQTATIRPMTEDDKAALAAQEQQDMLAKITGRYFHDPTLYYEEAIPQKVNDVIESYKNGVPDERNPRLRTTPKNVFGYRSGDDYSKERAQEYAKENPGEVAYFVGSGNQVRAYYSEKGEEPISILLRGRTDLEDEATFFQGGAFEDGWDFGDGLKTIAATAGDVVSGVAEGFASAAEGISDLIGYGVAWGAEKLGYEDYAEDVRFRAQENTVADWFDDLNDDLGITDNSLLGDKADAVTQGVGQLGFLWATGGLGKTAKSASAISRGTLFAMSTGSGMSEAYQGDATDGEAFAYGVANGVTAVITELLVGGTGKAFGNVIGKPIFQADDAVAKAVGNSVTRIFGTGTGAHATKVTSELIVKAGFEGLEEVIEGIANAGAKKLTYMSDEEIAQLIADENLMDQFITGMLVSGIAQGGDVNTAIKTKTDLITGRTEIEDAVVNKEYEKRVAEAEKDGKLTAKEKREILESVERDFAEGGISIDTIEEALGGDTYTEYQNAVNEQEAMQKEYDELYNMKNGDKSDADADRQAELKQKLDELKNKSKADEIHKRLSDEVFTRAKDSRLVESYAERERRKQAYQADLSQYDEKQRETVQRAVDSGILNNTRKTHKFVDMIAKISADKGVSFDFTNNAKLKESGFAVDGKQVNGYWTANGVTVNINSNKALNSVVGHEITHVLEGTNLYTELQSAVKQYAESKGEYQTRVEAITKLYEGMDADIDAEVTADLVGDYLFTDPDFVQRLSTEHRNVFQKVYAEIKYLTKVATAGSKELRQLEKAKKVFEDAYRGDSNGVTDVKNSISNRESTSRKAPIISELTGREITESTYDTLEKLERGEKVDLSEIESLAEVQEGKQHLAEATNKFISAHPELPELNNVPAKDVGTHLLNSAEREQLRNDILAERLQDGSFTHIDNDGNDVYNGSVEKGRRLDIVIGLPAAGKSTAIVNPLSQYYKSVVIDSDIVKGMLPEYDGGWGASLVHEESSDINALLYKEELRIGNNIVLPIVGGKVSSVEKYIDLAKERDYSVHLHLNELSSGKALGRNLRRYFNTGRFIDPAIAGKYGDAPTQVYEEMKARSDIDGYSRWSNDVPKGQRPTNVEHSGGYGLYIEYSGTWRASRGTGADRSTGGSPQGESGSLENSGNGVAGTRNGLEADDSGGRFPDQGAELSQVLRLSLSPKTKEAIAKSGVVGFELVDSTNDSGAFSNALNAARNADPQNGWAVTPKSAQELDEGGVRTVMSSDGKAGLGVTPDGDIVAVFKNQEGGPPKALDTLIPAALEMGGKKLDCYGAGLVKLYSQYGFVPVARVEFNPEYANDGWTPDKGELDIFFMVHNGDSSDTVLANKGKYKAYTAEELKALPLFGKEAYDDAWAYRDAMIQQDIVRNSLSNGDDIAPAIGSYTVYGKDIALEDLPIREDVTPVQDTVQPAVQESVFPDDFAPTTEAEANALADESLPTFTDEDAPPVADTEYDDFSDTTALDPKALKDISKALKDVLYLNNKEVKAIADVVQKYSTTEFPDRLDLFYELQAKFGTKETVARNEETAAIKKALREYPINVSQAIKKDITDYGAFMRRNFGKVRFSKEGVPVDSAYQDLSSMFPGYFPADITNASDQLLRISEIAGMEINETETFELSDEDIMEAVDVIEAEVAKYKEAAVQTAAEADRQAAFAHIDDIAPVRDDIAPAVEIPAPADTSKPIKTVKERLSAKLQNYQTELATNQQQRIDSQASYEEEISRLYAEYSGKKNKNTQVANDILRRIDRLQTMKGNVDADYAKRISDLEAKVAQLTEEVRTGESTTEQAAMRSEVHAAIVDNIKTTFAEKGIDFDKVLENAKDLSTFSTVDNTPQRVLEKALGYKEGQILSDLTVNKVAQNETEGIKWLNDKVDLIKQISKQYHIKPGSKESAAAQMYAEGFYVNKDNEIIQYGDAELAKDFPDTTKQARIKGLAKDPRIRQIYDETLAAINESRARNAYPEIQRLDNYFLHFRAQTDTFSRLGIPFNPKDIKAKDLPTDLNGVTADLKPGQPYFASAMHRQGKRTSFDLLGGLEQYLTGAKDQIYHIDDIQTLRALRNYIADNYGQAKGLDNLDALTEEEAEAKIKEVFSGHLSTMAKFLNEEANVIAGKTSLTDRGLEGVIGRRGITFLADLNKQVGSNMVGFNISSSMTNVLSAVQGFAKTNKVDFVKAMAQTTANKIKSINGKGDSFAEQSPVIVRRKGADRYHRTVWQKTSDAGYWLMGAVDNVSTEIIARAKYNELTRKGMDSQQAHQETDKWVSRLMGDRSLGQQPQLYNSKMLGMLTKFQLEVRNQLDSQFYDTIKEADVATEDIENALKRNSKKAAKIASTFFQLAVAQHLFGKAFESIAGYNPAFDIISVLIKTFGWDDDEDDDDTVLDNIEQGFQELLGDLPYTSTFTGGRIPISSALPIKQLVTGEDQYGNEKSRWETIKETAPYYLLPSGYSQIKKTVQGLGMFDDDLPVAGSYTDSGNLRYPVEETFGNKLQAALFGQYANKNARDYFDNERAPLKEKQIEEYIDLDLPIAEYWEYREGLAEQDTVEEKLDYIDSLDLPISKKNIMANNVTDRKNPIDMTGYGDFDSLAEFDFATKNPEKYEFFERSGITYAAYANGDEDAKRAYNWAYDNPEKYIVSQAVTSDVVEYRRYASELNDITADKDENGKTISGSRKEKVIDYINNMDADYGAKIILFRTQYTSDDTYNNEIVEYLNNRDDISYSEMVTILEELDFTVYPDGTVVW